MDEDTMYFHQAIRKPYKEKFFRAIVKKVNVHYNKDLWNMMPKEVPPKANLYCNQYGI